MHVIPRLVALMGARLDPSLVPAMYVYSSLAVTLLVVALVFSPRLELPCKPLLALAIVAVPDTGEVFLTVANIQWITALALVMALLKRDPGDAAELAGDSAILLLAGLTGPFCIMLLPFFLFRALSRASLQSWALFAIVLMTAFAQGRLILRDPPAGLAEGIPWLAGIPRLSAPVLSRVPLSLLGAQGWVYRVGRSFVLCAGWAGALAMTAMACARGPLRGERICLLLFAIILTVSATARFGAGAWDYRDMVSGDRYFYVQKVLLTWILISLLSRRLPGVGFPLALPVVAGLFLVAMISYVEPPDFETHHVERPWLSWDNYSARLRTGKEVAVEVSPNWTFVVPARVPVR